jgi:hypothetical protein
MQSIQTPTKRNILKTLVKKLIGKVARLFEPEEVEVTFKVEGKNVTYTYTKVNPKQVA